jgi:serine/threonine protein kinase
MICGHPYTQAADIWSSGIFLYSLTTGLLPFDDELLQGLLAKIVTQEVAYPSFLSPSLVDLLRRILTKNPEHRITLSQIREHSWLSHSRYAALFAIQFGERSADSIVDPELVEQMTRMGIDTAQLRQQLLLGAFTELTAMYRMIRRNRLTDAMLGLIANAAEGGLRPDDEHQPFTLHNPTRRSEPRTIVYGARTGGGFSGFGFGADRQKVPVASSAVTQRTSRPLARHSSPPPIEDCQDRDFFDDCDVFTQPKD